MFKLFYYQDSSYVFVGKYNTEQECNQKAFEDNKNHFRIEQEVIGGSTVVFDNYEQIQQD